MALEPLNRREESIELRFLVANLLVEECLVDFFLKFTIRGNN